MKSYIKGYPRPQLVRKTWQNLNGEWNFAFDDQNQGEKEHWEMHFPRQKQINVPFSYETKLSGIGEQSLYHVLWYQRDLVVDATQLDGRYFIHFEGCDYLTKVYINQIYIGKHRGGYNRFSFDVTGFLHEGVNTLTVRVEDSCDLQQPRGKQRWMKNSFACWYIQTSGIWKTVWAEWMNNEHIEKIKITPSFEHMEVKLEAEITTSKENLCLKAEVYYGDILVNSSSQKVVVTEDVYFVIDLFNTDVSECGVQPWSPEHPQLYDLKLTLISGAEIVDSVASYFGLREIRIDKQNILLNGAPIYQRLILDQGYWEDSHLSMPDEHALIDDIDKIIALGYNGLRMHQKVEDERFLYWCDVKGLFVWCEAPSAYKYSDDMVTAFVEQWMETVKQFYNHPSIIVWTVLNESWGVPQIKFNRTQQHFSEMLYHLTKSIDSMRPVIVNDGWEHTVSDIITLHDYEENGDILYERYTKFIDEILCGEVYHSGSKSALSDGFSYNGQPIIMSEYGGIAFADDKQGWGYGEKVKDEASFLSRFDSITTAIKKLPYVCGYCYTQLTDVQQEINGLMDINHSCKVEAEKIREINMRNVGLHKQTRR